MLIGQDPSADRASAERPAPLTAPGMKRMKILRYRFGENTRSSACWFVPSANKRISTAHMSIADAIVYLLATSNCGMRTETIAREINLRGLHHRKDGKPVTSEQVYAVCMANKGVFCKDGGLIRLLM